MNGNVSGPCIASQFATFIGCRPSTRPATRHGLISCDPHNCLCLDNTGCSAVKTVSVYAETARFSLGQLPPTEAIYFTATHDAQNKSLEGDSNCTISFPFPLRVKAFWSFDHVQCN